MDASRFFEALYECKNRPEVLRLGGMCFRSEKQHRIVMVPHIVAIANIVQRPIEGSWDFDNDGGCEDGLCKAQILVMGETKVVWFQPSGDYVGFYLQEVIER